MNNTRLGVAFVLMIAALILGGTLADSSVNAIIVIAKYGGHMGPYTSFKCIYLVLDAGTMLYHLRSLRR